MKIQDINLETWKRKAQFDFFSTFDEPFFGITAYIDCTESFSKSKLLNKSFFLYYLYRAMKAANEIENFRYRIMGRRVIKFESISASPTISRDDGTFGFAYIDYKDDEDIFTEKATFEILKVKQSRQFLPANSSDNVIHISTLPWLNFTSITHARNFKNTDSCPKISFGKLTEIEGRKKIPVAIYVHHGLIDGYHIHLFLERFQQLLDE